jgi:outer membrane receptor protein involved in Fe transport
MGTTTRNSLLAATAAVAGLAAYSGAAAQDKVDTTSDQQSQNVITVTGSHIRSTFTTPTPVTAVSSEQLETAAPGNLVTALVQLPQFYNSTTTSDPGNFFTSPGSGNLNLRGLDPNRTLTLLNGRRVASSTRYGGTDINSFPEEMIKSVEAVTGGASAAYGSDAVSGVVNFILDTKFTGARAHAQYGLTERGDNANYEVGLAYGANIGERAHVQFSAEKYSQDGVYSYKGRDWYQQWGIVQPAGSGPLVRPGVTSTIATLNGVISAPGTALDRLEFLPDGQTTRPFVLGPLANTGGAYASQTAGPGSSGTDNAVHPTLQPETDRQSYFAYGSYDLTNDLQVFLQGMWGQNDTRSSDLGGYYVAPFAPLVIFQGNPYLPANINQIMVANNIPSITVQKIGSPLDTSNRYDIAQNTMRSITTGFDWKFLRDGVGGGDWLKGWDANSYYQWGQTSFNSIVRGGLRIDRLPLAVDAVRDPSTGQIVCRVNTQPYKTANGGRWSDCVPIDLFGQGNASPQALDWILGYDPGQQINTPLSFTDSGTSLGFTDSYVSSPDKVASGEINQNVFEVTFAGDIWEGWGAGAISGAFGYSYREESIFQVVRDPANPTDADSSRPVPANDATLGVRGSSAANSGNSVDIQFSKVPDIRGKLSTIEYYAETLVPLIANQPWMQQLNLSLAARRADYTGSGDIWAWKYGLDAQVTDEVRLRATRSRDIRAATLSERYDRTGGFGSVNNWNPPCLDATNKVVSCSIFTESGGNPDVKPEQADTTTAGVIYQPHWLNGLSVSVDWYDIELHDAIATLTAQQIADECRAGDQSLCDRIQLNAQGQPSLIDLTVLNINQAKVEGVDLEAGYSRPIKLFGGGESLAGRLYVGYLGENSRTNFGAPTIHQEESFLYPRVKVNAALGYDRGPLSLYVQERYQTETKLNRTLGIPSTQFDDNTIDAIWLTDLNASYKMNGPFGQWEVFGNIANLLDADPPIIANFANFGAVATQTAAGEDRLGRRYTIGVRLRH